MGTIDLSSYKKLYLQTASEYVNNLSEGLVRLSNNWQDKEAFNNIYISAHSLRSQSEVMGYTRVGELAGSIEKITKEIVGGIKSISIGFPQTLTRAVEDLRREIENLMSQIQGSLTEEARSETGLSLADGRKILLIEDDKFFQKFYSHKLEERLVKAEVACDGEEGLAKMKSFNPDIVLLDLIMPKKDGFFVLESRLQDERLKQIPVIIFSTLGQEKDIQRAKELGATDYINKGLFNFEDIMSKIKIYVP